MCPELKKKRKKKKRPIVEALAAQWLIKGENNDFTGTSVLSVILVEVMTWANIEKSGKYTV